MPNKAQEKRSENKDIRTGQSLPPGHIPAVTALVWHRTIKSHHALLSKPFEMPCPFELPQPAAMSAVNFWACMLKDQGGGTIGKVAQMLPMCLRCLTGPLRMSAARSLQVSGVSGKLGFWPDLSV